MANDHLSLSTPSSWAGVWTALITPLKTHSSGTLSLDHESLARLMDRQIGAGVRGLVIAGSTGEGSLLSRPLYQELLEAARKIAGQRIPLVAGLGIGGTESCLANAELAKSLGYSGVLASPPAYIKAPQRGLIDHYLAVASVGVPVCLYEVASRAATSIEISTLAHLAKSTHPDAKHLVSIKDASGNLQRAIDTRAAVGERFALLSGDDFTLAAFMAVGGSGVISVVSHLAPKAMVAIVKKRSIDEQIRIQPLIDACFWESNPIPVKSLAQKAGLISEAVFCPPLSSMDPAKLNRAIEVMARLGDHA